MMCWSPRIVRWGRLAHLARSTVNAAGLRGVGRLVLVRRNGAVVQVENTNYCSHRCTYCATHSPDSLLDEPRGHMTLATFRDILDENPLALLVVLQGDGEPLLDPGLFEKIALARSRGLVTQTISNGSMLDDAMIRRLLSDGPDIVLFSVDAISPERNDAIRRGMRCREVLMAIRALTAARVRERKLTIVGLLSVVHAGLADETEAALRAFNSLGIDILFHKPLNRSYENRIRGYRGDPAMPISPALRRRLHYPTRQQRVDGIRPCPQLVYSYPYYLWDGTRTACCIMGDRRYAAPDFSRDALLRRYHARALPAECERCSFFCGYEVNP